METSTKYLKDGENANNLLFINDTFIIKIAEWLEIASRELGGRGWNE